MTRCGPLTQSAVTRPMSSELEGLEPRTTQDHVVCSIESAERELKELSRAEAPHGALSSIGKPIFHPTQEFIDQPSHQKKTLSFSPARGKKREAERTKLDFQPATKKEKQKKEKKEKKQKKQKNHDKSKSKHKKSKKVRT